MSQSQQELRVCNSDQGMLAQAPVSGAALPELDRHPDTSHGVTAVRGRTFLSQSQTCERPDD